MPWQPKQRRGGASTANSCAGQSRLCPSSHPRASMHILALGTVFDCSYLSFVHASSVQMGPGTTSWPGLAAAGTSGMGVQGTLLRDAATRYVLMPQIAALIFDFVLGPRSQVVHAILANVQRKPIIFFSPSRSCCLISISPPASLSSSLFSHHPRTHHLPVANPL